MNEFFKKLWADQNFVVLDTETTGLRWPAEITDIAVLNCNGIALIDTLVKPRVAISEFITSITGITNEMVASAPSWLDIRPNLQAYLAGKNIITYNAAFDADMFYCSDRMAGLPETDWHSSGAWHCAMRAYAPHGKEWNEYRGEWKWIKLAEAMSQQGLEILPAHRAAADARMTYNLLAHMCK